MPNSRTVRKYDYDFYSAAPLDGYNDYTAARLTTFATFRTFTTFTTFRAKPVLLRGDVRKKAHFFYLKIIYYINIMLKYGKT